MLKSISLLGLFVPLAILTQGCGHLMEVEGHEKIVENMRAEIADLQAQAAETEKLRIVNARLRHENELFKAHNTSYGELSGELRDILQGLSEAGIKRMPNGAWSIEAHLLFAAGKSEISASGRETLRKFLQVWTGQDVRFKVVGHTDSDPIIKTASVYTTRTNLELGMHRALKVMEVLLHEGVEENRLTIESRGHSEPVVADDGTRAKKRRNRRVEIYVLK